MYVQLFGLTFCILLVCLLISKMYVTVKGGGNHELMA